MMNENDVRKSGDNVVKIIVVYAATLIAFCACDFLWLGWIAKDLYAKEIGALLLSSFKVGVGALFYAIYAGGVVVFCVYPALASDSWTKALTTGALFGFIAYATYDLTNLATLRGWSTSLSIIDMLWGASVTAIAAIAGYAAASRLIGS